METTTQEPVTTIRMLAQRLALVYLVAIVVAESVASFRNAASGLVLHAGIVCVATMHCMIAIRTRALADDSLDGILNDWSFLPAVALVPLLRVIDLTVPAGDLPVLAWYPSIAVPLLAGALLVTRLVGWKLAAVGIRRPSPSQLLVALTGVPLTFAGLRLMVPSPLSGSEAGPPFLMTASAVLFLAAFAEELVFRGVIQRALSQLFGPGSGIALTSVLSAAANSGSRSALSIMFNGAAAMVLGWCVHRTGSIAGAAAAHGGVNIGTSLVLPNL